MVEAVKDKVVDIFIDAAKSEVEVSNVIQGLTLAQIICRRRLLDAFDDGS